MGAYHWTESLDDLAGVIQPESILSRVVFKNEHVKAVLFAFDQGQALSEHQAAQPAVLQILSGEATLTLGDDVLSAQPGALAYLEPRLKHSVVAKTPMTMLLLLLQSKPDAV